MSETAADTTCQASTTFPPQSRPDRAEQGATNEGSRQDNDQSTSTTTTTTATPALTVRVNLIRRVYEALSVLGRTRRGTLAFSAFLTFSQIIAFSVVVGVAANQPCDYPLQAFLIMTIIKVALNFPLTFYHALTPIRPTRRDTAERIQQIEQTRRIGSQQTDHRVRKASDLTGIFALVLFILGNWWFFSSTTCRVTSPSLYWTTLAALIVSWLYVLEIVLIVIAVVFFLPLLLVGMRWAGVGEKKNEIGPLSKQEIGNLPLKVYAGPLPSTDDQSASNDGAREPTSIVATHSEPTKPSKRNWSRLWTNVRRSAAAPNKKGSSDNAGSQGSARRSTAFAHLPRLPSTMSYVELPDNQSSCAICLCDYEPPPSTTSPDASSWKPEPLRVLPCSHAFHSECLDSWLGISGRCALCQRPVVDRQDDQSTPNDNSAAQQQQQQQV